MPFPTIPGPAVVSFKGASFYTEKAITVDIKEDSVIVNADAFGEVERIRAGLSGTIKCIPVTASSVFWPHAASSPGTLLCGAVSQGVTITTLSGETYTFPRACISKLPSLKPTLRNALIGEIEFTVFPPEGAEIFTVTSGAAAQPSFNPDQIFRGPWTYTLGGVEFDTNDDISIDFNLSATVLKTAKLGPCDLIMNNLSLTANFKSVGASTLDRVVSSNLGVRGKDRSLALSIACEGFSITVPSMVPVEAQGFWGATETATGSLQLASIRTFGEGVPSALFTIGL